MEVKAHAKFIRMAPKKIRLVVDLIRGLDVKNAEAQLKFNVKLAKEPVLKLLRSAIANAEKNFELKKENLFVSKITVDEGPTLKRWHPRAHGRAATIRKRSSHVSIILNERTPAPVETDKKDKKAKADKVDKTDKKAKKVVEKKVTNKKVTK